MLQGIRHLWFVTAIMFAYLSTPILQWLSKYADWLFPVLLVCVGVSYVVAPGFLVFAGSWVFLYAIGYLYNHLNRKKIYDIGLLLLETALIVFIAWDFDFVTHYFHPLNRVFHDVSGVFLVIIGILVLSRISIKNIPSVVELFDKYSFHIFIVHYFFVIGPFSIAHITPYIIVNILCIIATTIVATFLFVKLNNLANRFVFDKMLKN